MTIHTGEKLDAIIARLARLRDEGVEEIEIDGMRLRIRQLVSPSHSRIAVSNPITSIHHQVSEAEVDRARVALEIRRKWRIQYGHSGAIPPESEVQAEVERVMVERKVAAK